MPAQQIAPLTAPKPTVDNWLASCNSIHTRRLYARVVGQYAHEVRQIVEAGRAQQIDAMWALRYVQVLRQRSGERAKHLAPSTINTIISALSSYWIWMQRHGLVSTNPWQHRRTQVADRTAQRVLSRDQVRDLLGAVPQGVKRTLVLALYSTGARVSEICRDPSVEQRTGRTTGLHWRDITSRRDGSAILTLYGKRQKTRLVPVSKAVITDIRGIARRHPADDYVFCHDRYDDAVTAWDAWDIVRRAARKAGIPGNVSPHWLRHSYATHMLQQGVPVNQVQALLGHSRLDTTGIYVKIVTAHNSTAYVDAL